MIDPISILIFAALPVAEIYSFSQEEPIGVTQPNDLTFH